MSVYSNKKKNQIVGYILNDLANRGFLTSKGNDLLNTDEDLPVDLVNGVFGCIEILFDNDPSWDP